MILKRNTISKVGTKGNFLNLKIYKAFVGDIVHDEMLKIFPFYMEFKTWVSVIFAHIQHYTEGDPGQ